MVPQKNAEVLVRAAGDGERKRWWRRCSGFGFTAVGGDENKYIVNISPVSSGYERAHWVYNFTLQSNDQYCTTNLIVTEFSLIQDQYLEGWALQNVFYAFLISSINTGMLTREFVLIILLLLLWVHTGYVECKLHL